MVRYLEEIFSGRGLISNGMRLDIPVIGEVTATSMANRHHLHGGKEIPYFNWRVGKTMKGEFLREDGRYFMESKLEWGQEE